MATVALQFAGIFMLRIKFLSSIFQLDIISPCTVLNLTSAQIISPTISGYMRIFSYYLESDS